MQAPPRPWLPTTPVRESNLRSESKMESSKAYSKRKRMCAMFTQLAGGP